jgi:hypothetical protein
VIPLATIVDMEDRYGRSFDTDEDFRRAETLLYDASALVIEVAGTDWTVTAVEAPHAVTLGTVPATVIPVVCEAARRAYDNPTGLQSETIGDYTWRGSTGVSAGVYLTAAERRIVLRAVGKVGVGSATLTSALPAPATDPLIGSYWGVAAEDEF